MKLEDYTKTQSMPLKQATLCFLVNYDSVLLAMKKRGFGINKYNGIGGKKDPEETIEEAAKRETREEIGVTIDNLKHVATFEFYYPHNPKWGQEVFVYLVREWEGEPQESEEMAPQWFKHNQIPFDKMWPDDKYWLPLILEGKKLKGKFLFGENEDILDYELLHIR